jgi:hypothetical protein
MPALAGDFEDAPQTRTVERRLFSGPGDSFTVIDGQYFPHSGMGKNIKNAPYSAESVTERIQTLSDGNQISKTASSMSYRDSAGRTRHEVREPGGELVVTTIQDPVEQVTWVLRPKDKTATKISRQLPAEAAAAAQAGRANAEAARARIEELRKEGKLPTVERKRTANGEEMTIRLFRMPELDKTITSRLTTQLAPLTNAIGDSKWASHATTRDLGTREFEGVKAQGKLRSYEIPAGAVGNRNPIVVSDETWYAPELQVTVYAKHNDPRSGESIVRLGGLRRTEPSPALFTVPADYKVKDAMANITRLEQKAQ